MYRVIIIPYRLIIISQKFKLRGIFIQINYVLLMILTIYYKPFKLLNIENKTDVAVWLMTMVVVGGTGGVMGGLGGADSSVSDVFLTLQFINHGPDCLFSQILYIRLLFQHS